MDKRYTFTDFIQLIERLRGEGGCPWDRAQTHSSLKPCMTEEAAELLAAIRIYEKTGNAENMREELGDVLLQAVMHSVIAQEEGLFTMDDVIEEVSEKMIRRHPHVFGSALAEDPGAALNNWEAIKKEEKDGKSWIPSPLQEIPQELPALARAVKVIKKADRLYGLKDGEDTLWQRLEHAFSQLRPAGESGERVQAQERMGDMLWLLCELAYRCGLLPEQILADRIADEIDFFEAETE